MPKLKRRSVSQKNAEMSRRMRERRFDDDFRLSDNRRRPNSHGIERADDEFRSEDNKRRAEAHKIERQDDEFKEAEGRKNALRMINSRIKYRDHFDDMKSVYELKIKEGPTHICSCCGGLWFDYFISEYTCEMLTKKIQALSIALSHPIYSYTKFNSDPTNRHFIPLNISSQDLVDRFSKGTSGSHLRYIGYKADTNKLAFCLFYNGTHDDALLPFEKSPQQFVPHFDIINMILW